jgi:hypothetical protein
VCSSTLDEKPGKVCFDSRNVRCRSARDVAIRLDGRTYERLRTDVGIGRRDMPMGSQLVA